MGEPWGLLVDQGHRALIEGRLAECERLAAEAVRGAPRALEPGLLAVAARREQGRAAEAELVARSVVADHPDAPEAQAFLGAVLADLGRDAEANAQLDLVSGVPGPPVVTALAAEIAGTLRVAHRADALRARLAPLAGEFLCTTGAVARHLGLLCHVLGRWDEAEAHFDAALQVNGRAGAPVLVAHTRRQYSALLRARGDPGDWERAIDLLAEAAAVYRRLEIDRLADEAEAVLRRSQDVGGGFDAAPAVEVFRRVAGGWELSYAGARATVADSPGLGHVAALLAAEGRPVHVLDLVAGPALRDEILGEYGSRLADLDAELRDVPDPLAAALARAERDFLRSEVAVLEAGAPAAGEVADRARRLVGLRIRTSIDRLEESLPALARHLRRSIRTGTFCLYEPDRPHRWQLGP